MGCKIIFKRTIAQVVCSFLIFSAMGQQSVDTLIISNLKLIEKSKLTDEQKLAKLYDLKKQIESPRYNKDSAYALLLQKLGVYEYNVNKSFTLAIQYTTEALRINTGNKPGSSISSAVIGYFNLFYYYQGLMASNTALLYCDSTIMLAKKLNDTSNIIDAKIWQTSLLYSIGDYQKCVEESLSGIYYSLKRRDSISYLAFLTNKAQALFFQNELKAAMTDLETLESTATKLNNTYYVANALKIKALVYKKLRMFSLAKSYFLQSIQKRIVSNDYSQIALDYIDLGNLLLDSLHNYSEANTYYYKAIEYGKKNKDSIVLAKATANLSEADYRQNNLKKAIDDCLEALKYLNINLKGDILNNPPNDKLSLISDKNLIMTIMVNKSELLLNLSKSGTNKKYLESCLKTSLITDSVITNMRHQQNAEQSKLYWRDYTRNFYDNAIQASYLARKPELVFFFMEKSRAVLLNDKLNELNASSLLSSADAAKQENYEIKIIELQQKLSLYPGTSKEYQTVQLQWIRAKNEFEEFIKSLGKNYPAYYQYKYADSVPALKDLQQFLAKNNQSFVHYFLGDTVNSLYFSSYFNKYKAYQALTK